MTPTSVGMRCPECVKQKTKVIRPGFAGGDPILTYTLIGMNVLAYVATLLTGSSLSGSIGGADSVLAKASLYGPAVANGDVWRIITAGFMHYGPLHLAFNMYMLYVLGQMLEPSIGRLRFGLIYAAGLIGGSLGALILSPNSLTAGASGAVFGLAGAGVVIMRNRGINPMESGLGFFIFLNLAITLTVSNISIGGHIGGLIAGAAAAWLVVEMPGLIRLPRWGADAAAAGMAVALFVVAIAIA
jgi:membrane associated rhomboid family serine protease